MNETETHDNEMPLEAEELAELSDEAWDLIEQIRTITDEDGDGGRQVTRSERRELLRRVTALAAQLALDIVD